MGATRLSYPRSVVYSPPGSWRKAINLVPMTYPNVLIETLLPHYCLMFNLRVPFMTLRSLRQGHGSSPVCCSRPWLSDCSSLNRFPLADPLHSCDLVKKTQYLRVNQPLIPTYRLHCQVVSGIASNALRSLAWSVTFDWPERYNKVSCQIQPLLPSY